jgi:hypothetical protein
MFAIDQDSLRGAPDFSFLNHPVGENLAANTQDVANARNRSMPVAARFTS